MNSDPRRLKLVPRAAEKHALPALQSRSRETRARILAAAEKEFAEKGYDGATLADIAQRADCSVGAVYFRFKDKSALFLAIAESFVEQTRAEFAGLMRAADRLDADYVVRQFVAITAWQSRRHRGLFRAMVERGFEQSRAVRLILRLRDDFAETLETVLKDRGRRNLNLRVRVMTQMVYGFLLTGILNAKAPTEPGDARALSELANACIAYLREGHGK